VVILLEILPLKSPKFRLLVGRKNLLTDKSFAKKKKKKKKKISGPHPKNLKKSPQKEKNYNQKKKTLSI